MSKFKIKTQTFKYFSIEDRNRGFLEQNNCVAAIKRRLNC